MCKVIKTILQAELAVMKISHARNFDYLICIQDWTKHTGKL